MTLFDTAPSVAEPMRSAWISDDGIYRYDLARQWGVDGGQALWVMLNPSVADASIDDQTVRQCTTFSKQLGCVGLAVVNLFAYRATKPADMRAAARSGIDIIGPENDGHIRRRAAAHHVEFVICAWGANAPEARANEVALALLAAHGPRSPLLCLGRTADGSPRHPGRLAHSTKLEVFACRG